MKNNLQSRLDSKLLNKIIIKIFYYDKLLMSIAIVYFLSSIFWGLDFTDGFFHINQAILTTGKLPFETILTSHILLFLYQFFGKQLIIWRLLNAIILLISFLLIFSLNKKSNINVGISRILFSFILFIFTPLNTNIIGYDTFTVFFVSFFIYYLFTIEILKTKHLFLLSLILSIILLIRVPNIVLLPLVYIYFHFVRKRNEWSYLKMHQNYFLTVFYSIVFFLFYLYATYHNLDNLIESFASGNKHGIGKMLHYYFSDFKKIFFYSLFFIFFYFFIAIQKKSLLLTLIFPICFFWVLFLTHHFSFLFHWQYSLILSSFFISFFLLQVINFYKIDLKILFVFLIMFTICFLSNTGLLKFTLLSNMSMIIIAEKFNKKTCLYLLSVLLFFLPYSIMERTSSTFEDKGYCDLKKQVKLDDLQFIYTTKNQSDYIEKVSNISASLKQQGYQVIYYGLGSHLFSFVDPMPRKIYSYYQDYLNNNEINEIIKQYKNSRTAIILFNLPSNAKLHTVVEKKLIKHGFKLNTNNYLSIYLIN